VLTIRVEAPQRTLEAISVEFSVATLATDPSHWNTKSYTTTVPPTIARKYMLEKKPKKTLSLLG